MNVVDETAVVRDGGSSLMTTRCHRNACNVYFCSSVHAFARRSRRRAAGCRHRPALLTAAVRTRVSELTAVVRRKSRAAASAPVLAVLSHELREGCLHWKISLAGAAVAEAQDQDSRIRNIVAGYSRSATRCSSGTSTQPSCFLSLMVDNTSVCGGGGRMVMMTSNS